MKTSVIITLFKCVRTGAWKVCRRAIKNAKASIDLNETQDHTDASAALQGLSEKDKDKGITAADKTAEEEDISKKEATGGKRAWKTLGADEDPGSDTRAQSLEIFRKHKREGTLPVPEFTMLQTFLLFAHTRTLVQLRSIFYSYHARSVLSFLITLLFPLILFHSELIHRVETRVSYSCCVYG